MAAAALQAVDGAERVRLEGDHDARPPDDPGEAAVPAPRAPVPPPTAARVVAVAALALMTHDHDERHRPCAPRPGEVVPQGEAERSREVTKPVELRLAREPPSQRGPVAPVMP